MPILTVSMYLFIMILLFSLWPVHCAVQNGRSFDARTDYIKYYWINQLQTFITLWNMTGRSIHDY